MRQNVVEGEGLDLVDFVKAHPSASVAGLGKAMREKGGDHPFSWCVSKTGNKALCAAAHIAEYGKTPSERKKDTKG